MNAAVTRAKRILLAVGQARARLSIGFYLMYRSGRLRPVRSQKEFTVVCLRGRVLS